MAPWRKSIPTLLLLSLLPLLARADGDEPATDPVDAAAGAPFWADSPQSEVVSLWSESADAVAKRLKIPRESKTATQASYRLYPKPELRLFGARPYSVALYARDEKPTEFSIVFANGGDYFTDAANVGDVKSRDDVPKLLDAFAKQLRGDEETIRAKLEQTFGKPGERVYVGERRMEIQYLRWQWRDVCFLLARPEDKYVLLRIVPTESAVREVPKWQERKDQLAQRVIKRENGDTVVGEIPMVDQGPKGYCVPATWERYLRYLDIPADMYVLAQIGGTQLAGGTDPGVMAQQAQDIAFLNGLRIDGDTRPLVFGRVKDSIDRGLPFMWGCRAGGQTEKWISEWTERRKKTEWADWVRFVKERPPLHQAIDGEGHMRMIIGYNEETHEVAISDSWGQKFVERWLPFDVFEQLTKGQVYTIKW